MSNGILYTFGERLEYLMEISGINISVKGSNIDLARKMMKEGCLDFYVNSDSLKRLDSTRSQIEKHRKVESAADISGKWLKAYCDYFKCSADFLFGYIDLPTHKTTDINKKTGLSKSVIENLEIMKTIDGISDTINQMFEAGLFNAAIQLNHGKECLKIYYDLQSETVEQEYAELENTEKTLEHAEKMGMYMNNAQINHLNATDIFRKITNVFIPLNH